MYLFPAKLLRRLMADRGLHEIKRRCIYGSHSNSVTSLAWLVEAYLGRGWFSRALQRVLLSLPARVLMAPYFKLIDLCGLGSNINLVFRKQGQPLVAVW